MNGQSARKIEVDVYFLCLLMERQNRSSFCQAAAADRFIDDIYYLVYIIFIPCRDQSCCLAHRRALLPGGGWDHYGLNA